MMTICLNMIVKNEAPVIRRCLDSLVPLIDSWVIVDTGSTDGTQEIIRDHLAAVPGELVERPWVNFAHNRNEALELARGRADYLLLIDADETLELSHGFARPQLTGDSYNFEVFYGGSTYLRKQLVKASLPWRYVGVVHEYLRCDEAGPDAFLPGVRTIPRHDGARARDRLTYRQDALLLERALLDEPDNSRTVFYLAQSYRDAGEYELSIRHYRRRAEMGGWPDEVWYSLYQIAILRERLGHPWPEVMQDYLAAFQSLPDRAGPLYRIGIHYQVRREHHLAHLHFARAMRIPPPTPNRLFVERPIYEFMLPYEYAVASFYVGEHEAAIETANALLRSPAMPPQAAGQLIRNRRFSIDALQPKAAGSGEAVHLTVVVEAGDGLESGDPRLTVVAADPSLGWDESVARIAATLGARDVVVPLPRPVRLADPSAVATILRFFDDARCSLLYGGHRLEDGRMSDAAPASGAMAFHARGVSLAGASPLMFRAPLIGDAANETAPLRERLWRAAGWSGARFADELLTTAFRDEAGVAPALEAEPMISCLMVTRNRPALAKRAIRSFADQSWPNRELVMVTDGTEEYRRELVECARTLGIGHFTVVDAPDGTPLGRLRNMALDAAAGQLVCQWDDDDASHPDRLRIQAETLRREGALACCVTDHLQYLEERQTLLWIDWTMGGRITDERRFFPGSLLMVHDRRFRYPEQGAYARRGEDSVMLAQLARNGRIAALSGMGQLYLYHYHGANTFDRAHHEHISTCSESLAFVRARETAIREAVAYYSLPSPLTVLGADGPAFVIESRSARARQAASDDFAQLLATALGAEEAFRPYAPLDVRVVREARGHATRLHCVEVALDGRRERLWVKSHLERPADAHQEWSFLQQRARFGGYDLAEAVAYLPALQAVVTRHFEGERFADRLARGGGNGAERNAHDVGAWLGSFHRSEASDGNAVPAEALLDDVVRRLSAVAPLFGMPAGYVDRAAGEAARRAEAIPLHDLRRVRTHGDFGVFNILVGAEGGAVIDPSFDESVARFGNYCSRYEDCARFVVSVAATPGLAPEAQLRIAGQLRAGYAQSAGVDPFASPAFGLLRAKHGLQAIIDSWEPIVDDARRRGLPELFGEWLESRDVLRQGAAAL